MNEEAPIVNPEQSIIDSVPGVTPQEPTAQVPQDATLPLPGNMENPVVVDNESFHGDPRNVPGYPSNPMGNASQAYAEHLAENAVPVVEPAPLGPNAITEVPK